MSKPNKKKTQLLSYNFCVGGNTRVIWARNQREAIKRAETMWGKEAFPLFTNSKTFTKE